MRVGPFSLHLRTASPFGSQERQRNMFRCCLKSAWTLCVIILACQCESRERVDFPESDAGTQPDSGRYQQHGVYSCCAEGEGTACCNGKPQGTCFQYGGVSGHCADEGDTLEAKDICSICCAGLVRIESTTPVQGAVDGGTICQASAPPSVFYCTQCGDGTCGAGENLCNCPQDCKAN